MHYFAWFPRSMTVKVAFYENYSCSFRWVASFFYSFGISLQTGSRNIDSFALSGLFNGAVDTNGGIRYACRQYDCYDDILYHKHR